MLLEWWRDEKSFGLFEFKTFGEYHDLCQIRIGKGGVMIQSLRWKVGNWQSPAIEILSEFIPWFLHKAIEYSMGLIFWFPIKRRKSKRFFGKLEDELHDICYNSFSKVGNTDPLSIPLDGLSRGRREPLKRGDKQLLDSWASGFLFLWRSFVLVYWTEEESMSAIRSYSIKSAKRLLLLIFRSSSWIKKKLRQLIAQVFPTFSARPKNSVLVSPTNVNGMRFDKEVLTPSKNRLCK